MDHRDDRGGRQAPNGFIDTSAYSTRRSPAELVDDLGGRGTEKMLFGTNYPMMTAERALAHLDAPGLDDRAREQFLSGNARRVSRIG